MLILIYYPSLSQKEYYNWFFGDSAGITFMTPDKVPISTNLNKTSVYENTSIISTPEGNIKFFSASGFTLDSNLRYVPGGGTYSSFTSTQGGVFVKICGDRYMHVGRGTVVFYNSKDTIINIDTVNNTIDTTIKDIIGTDKKRNLISDSERLLLVKNLCGGSFYVVTLYKRRNQYMLYHFNLRTEAFELVDSLETKIPQFDIETQLKFNKKNNTIINLDRHFYEILKLDCENNKLELVRHENAYFGFNGSSGEFSPNGKYFYFLDTEGIYVMNNMDQVETKYPVAQLIYDDINLHRQNDLVMGPDSVIYISNYRTNELWAIRNSDDIHRVYLDSNAVRLDGKCQLSLPHIPNTFYDYTIDNKIVTCEGKNFELSVNADWYFDNPRYEWTGPNGFTSNERTIRFLDVTVANAGTYQVKVADNSGKEHIYESVVFIDKFIDSDISIEPFKPVYYQEDVELKLEGEYDNYLWSTGERTQSIIVNKSGKYKVRYWNETGCFSSKEVDLLFKEEFNLYFSGSRMLCTDEETILTADSGYVSYLWSNGDTTRKTVFKQAGIHWLEIVTPDGFIVRDSIELRYYPKVHKELKEVPLSICKGDSIKLELKYPSDYYNYLWNNGSTNASIYVGETGTFKLTITDTRTGCSDSTEITIKVEDNLDPIIIGIDICEGETTTLEALPNDPSYSYEWSNGETTPTIEVSQPATYTVTVSKDGCSGTAEFTVNESTNPEFEILGEDIVCGNSATLTPDKDFAEYLWSTDEITKEIEVTEAGTYSLTVTDENGCQATEEFTVNEQSLSFDISKERIDFGKVYISDTAIDSATIINTSGIELTITDGTQNYTVPDGFPVEYTKTLEPTELGPYTDSFEYRVISPCDTVITIPVTAEVYAKATISTEEIIKTEIGKEETIPVYLSAETDLGEQTYTITTDIDKTLLFTEDDFTFTQTAPINKTTTKVHEISGKIMLSSELEYDITFPNYDFNNPYIELDIHPGKIIIDSTCAYPFRSVTLTEPTVVRVSPNPAKDRLVVVVTTGDFDKLINQSNKSVAEPVEASGQKMKLELISAEGRVAYTENWTQTSSVKQVIINTDKIPSGLYQVRLKTSGSVLTENVIVVR